MTEPQGPYRITPPPGLLPPLPAPPPQAAPAPSPAPQPVPLQTGTAPLRGRSFATPAPGAVFGGVLAETETETEPDAPTPVLVLEDGRRIPITVPLLLGRDPAPRSEHPDALVVPVADARRSVSKTHALLLVRGGRLLVQDLGSTNGTWLVRADGRVAEAPSGQPAEVPADARIELGECPLRVERG